MKYALLGDIHANRQALDAVLEDARAQKVTHYACLGDIVGYNADPKYCLTRVRELDMLCVRGNHDHYCSHNENLSHFQPLAAEVIDWTRRHLNGDGQEYLRTLPLSRRVETFTLVHSTLDMPEMWGYVFDKLEAEAHFNYQTTSVCFFGHTHMPMAFVRAGDIRVGKYQKLKVSMGRKFFINVGSVGQPRDGDPRATYALYDLLENHIELRRVPYDIPAAQAAIRAAGLPGRNAARLAAGR